jgi:hypothetical protein
MRTIIFGCAAAALIACGGRMSGNGEGLAGPTVGGETADYPTGAQGFDVGDVVPNIAFVAYEHLDPTTKIDTGTDPIGAVRLSDFYDPIGERGLTFLYVSLQYVWCEPSNEQDDFTNGANYGGQNTGDASFASQYAAKGVRFMTLLADGPSVGTDATVQDLMNWVNHHEARISEGIIPHDELTMNVLGAAAPYNMIVDVRTMRVVDVAIGFDTSFSKLASLVAN